MFFLTLIVSSFSITSMRHYRMYYLSLFFVRLVSNNWDAILGSI